MGFLIVLITVVFILVCILMIVVVLIQPHEGSGLASAFGGGVSDSFFGTKALTYAWKFTIVLVIIYFALAVLLNKLPRPAATTESPFTKAEEPAPKGGEPGPVK